MKNMTSGNGAAGTDGYEEHVGGVRGDNRQAGNDQDDHAAAYDKFRAVARIQPATKIGPGNTGDISKYAKYTNLHYRPV